MTARRLDGKELAKTMRAELAVKVATRTLLGKRLPGLTGNRRFQIVNSRVALGDHPCQFNQALKAAIRFLTHLTSDPGQLR